MAREKVTRTTERPVSTTTTFKAVVSQSGTIRKAATKKLGLEPGDTLSIRPTNKTAKVKITGSGRTTRSSTVMQAEVTLDRSEDLGTITSRFVARSRKRNVFGTSRAKKFN